MRVLLGIVIASTAFLSVHLVLASRQRRRGRERADDGMDAFLTSLSALEVSPLIGREVYTYFQKEAIVKNLRLRPEDDLYQVFGIVEEDLDDAVVELARRCGRKDPTTDSLRGLGTVRSVGDLARIISKLPPR